MEIRWLLCASQQQVIFEQEGSSGRLQLYWHREGVLVLVGRGHISEELVDGVVAALDRATQTGSITFFVDFFDLTGYVARFRSEATEVMRKNRAHVSKIHVGIGSKIIAMGVSVANLVLGNVQGISDREKFKATLGPRQ